MEMSEQVNELFSALSKAQGELKNAVCDTKAHGYDYAKLVQYIDIAKPILPKHGLCVTQLVSGNDGVVVTTILGHSSGQWISTTATVPAAVLHGGAGKNPVQVAGTQITYMRRYMYSSILGMTDNAEDNDAQGLVSPPKQKPAMQQPRQLTAPKQAQPKSITRAEFEAGKHKWAAEAVAIGAGGVEKVIAKTGKVWSENAEAALRELVIEVAKSKQKTESGLVDGSIEVREDYGSVR